MSKIQLEARMKLLEFKTSTQSIGECVVVAVGDYIVLDDGSFYWYVSKNTPHTFAQLRPVPVRPVGLEQYLPK